MKLCHLLLVRGKSKSKKVGGGGGGATVSKKLASFNWTTEGYIWLTIVWNKDYQYYIVI